MVAGVQHLLRCGVRERRVQQQQRELGGLRFEQRGAGFEEGEGGRRRAGVFRREGARRGGGERRGEERLEGGERCAQGVEGWVERVGRCGAARHCRGWVLGLNDGGIAVGILDSSKIQKVVDWRCERGKFYASRPWSLLRF